MTYFWGGSVLLEPGSVVAPGNWGRIVSMWAGHTARTQELVFEGTRHREFSNMPSRFKAAFAFRTESDLSQFLAAANRTLDVAYEVELADPAQATLEADIDLVSGAGTLADMEARARAYWSGQQIGGPREVVTLSALRIVRAL